MALVNVKLVVSTIPRSMLVIIVIIKYIYGDLEVGFVESSSSTLVRERNPRVRSSNI